MTELTFTADGAERVPLKVFTEKAYLDYSMYVILDRALPHIGDGLKPVQRRIVYAMSELGLNAGAKHKKSARTVGDCFVKGTLVSTGKGLLPIEHIERGDRVYTQTGLHPVTELYEMPAMPLLKVTLENGQENIVTPGQQFKVINQDFSFSWVKASELSSEHWVVLKSVYPDSISPIELGEYDGRIKFLNEKIAYLLGIFTSDGWVSKEKKTRQQLGFCSSESSTINRIASYIIDEFGYTPKIEIKKNTGFKKNGDPYLPLYVIRISRDSINNFFDNHFQIRGRSAITKTIPDSVLKSPKEIILSFVSGLIDGDGLIHPSRNMIHYGSISRELIGRLQVLLQSLGLKSNSCIESRESFRDGVTSFDGVTRSIYKKNVFMYLEIRGDDAVCLASMLNLSSCAKTENLKKILMSKKTYQSIGDILPYAAMLVFNELSRHHLGGDWFQDVDRGKFRQGVSYRIGAKIRYHKNLKDTDLHFKQILSWDLLSKLERIGSKLASKIKEFISNGLFFAKVKEVRSAGLEKTYDLQVDQDHMFVANGMVVHNCLGKYHPHGDSACYEAMVLMAQPFSYRYPLVDGQGNWGSPDDPKSFAAMRYTEARLSPFAQVLLAELGQGTVDWTPNFDGTLDEPVLLPARLPNVLLNGATGIAVGMATDIPPHHLGEVAAACIHLLDQPDCDLDTLCELVPAPDYPGGAEIITPREELRKLYQTGNGAVRLRARFERENGDVIITALPHQVSGARLMEQIAAQMRDKKLPMVEDLRDESDHENPTRLVLVLRSNRVDVDMLMDHLFATTDLEKSYRVNLNMIGLDGRPQVKNLKQILEEWLRYRLATVRRRLEYRLNQVDQRLHILDGLLIAYLNLDEVIRILRTEDKPKPVLMARFQLSDVQAEAILETKLRHLARLEEIKLRGEQDELRKEQDQLQQLLGSEKRLKTLIRKEIQDDAKRYADPRRCPLVERRAAQALDEASLTPSEPMVVVLSQKGWVRAAKGREIDAAALSYRAGDGFLDQAQGRSNQSAVFLDTTGRTYTLPVAGLASARGYGEPLTGKLSPPDGARFVSVLLANPEDLYLLATDAGYGFICTFDDLVSRNKAGKLVLTVPEGARILAPLPVVGVETDRLAAVGSGGRLLLFPVKDLPRLPKGKGNKILDLPGEERLVTLTLVPPERTVVLTAGKRDLKLKPADLEGYAGERGRRGKPLPRGFQRVERLIVAE